MKRPKIETKPGPDDARDVMMVTLRQSGRTLQQIATQYGLTRERVRQIVAKHERREREAARMEALAKAERELPALARESVSQSNSRFSAENNDLSAGCEECNPETVDRRSARLLAAASRACAPKE